MFALVVGWRFKALSVSWPHSRNLIALVWVFALALLLFQLVVHRMFVLNALTLFAHSLVSQQAETFSKFFFPCSFSSSFYCSPFNKTKKGNKLKWSTTQILPSRGCRCIRGHRSSHFIFKNSSMVKYSVKVHLAKNQDACVFIS